MPRFSRMAPLAAVALMAACSSANIKPAEVNPTDMPKGPGLLSGKSGNLLEAFNRKANDPETAGGTIGVNIFLWRAALETVSFMPITQADSNGGVIATDWFVAPGKSTERVRANVLILGKTLQASALKVSLFKQIQGKDGKWGDMPVSPATVRELEDRILTKARALKVQTLATQ